jgi:hypothetical protein
MRNLSMVRPALLAVGVAVMLAACQREQNNDATGAAVRDVPADAVSKMSTAQPATAPANDPSLPPYGTAPAPSTGETGTPTDGAHTALTANERSTAQPLEGQVNNYSSDAFAKRGDSNVEHTQEGPRGSEAVATPNSYPKESK